MLESPRMARSAFRSAALLGGLAFLATIPSETAVCATLREDAVGYRIQGYEAHRRGDQATALAFYRKAAELDPTYATPHNDAGILLEEQGQLGEAERAYQRALALNPNYLEAHANLAMLYERLGEKEKAVYHWTKRYQLGDASDPWTARAEERLAALGVLNSYPGIKGKIYTRRHLVDQELKDHAQSLEEYRTATEEHGDWP